MNGQNYRCGWVALMGPPNAGKSTLLNGLMGQKVTIVTPKPQTTRNQIVGILTDGDAQAIFMDTPGLSQVRGRLSKTTIQAVWQSLGQADVIMPVLDAHLYIRHPEYLDRDLAPVAEALASDERPMVVVANKVDLFADKSRMLPLLTRLNEMWPRAEIFPVSALNKDGLPELARLIKKQLPEGMAQFPEDQISTAPVRFMAAEIVREKLFLHLRQEVPYGIAVEVENWEEDPEREQTIIHAVIYVGPSHAQGHGHRPRRLGAEAGGHGGPSGHPRAHRRQGASGTVGQGPGELDGRHGLPARAGHGGRIPVEESMMMDDSALRERYRSVLERLGEAVARAGRTPEEVRPIAVSKLHPAADVACGRRRTGGFWRELCAGSPAETAGAGGPAPVP